MSVFEQIRRALESAQPLVVVTVLAGERAGEKLVLALDDSGELINGTLGDAALDDAAARAARAALENNAPSSVTLRAGDVEAEVFLDVYAPKPRLIIVGAVHVAIHLVRFAKELGFHTIVVDARATFASNERFPHADELLVEWPADALSAMDLHHECYFAFLSHDPKLDDPALVVALRSPARYVGALGSKKTHAKRTASLAELGLAPEQITRIHNPIGLKLGGRRPEEIALGVAAQLVQARYGQA